MPIHTPSSPDPDITVNVVPLKPEQRRYMIVPRCGPVARMAGVQPMSAAGMNEVLSTLGIDVVRRIRVGGTALRAMGAGEATDIVVAQIEPIRANALRRSMPPNLIIAEDRPLTYGATATPHRVRPLTGVISATAPVAERMLRFQVVGQAGRPLPRVTVQLLGDTFPAQGLTDENGEVALKQITFGDRFPRLLTATATHSYWDIYLRDPQVTYDRINRIRMRSLHETIPGFPQQFRFGWGQRLMGLDQLPKEVNGAGVKIAIIDSGCDNSHPLLRHIRNGRDCTGHPDPAAWNQDLIGHGTHCAGLIAARSDDGTMMRGFAPEAELHILRVSPGGSYSSLTEALLYCIEHQIDVVNISLGGEETAVEPGVEQFIEWATLNGIACVVAAGNSGDAVKYPARSPQTLAVAALGSWNDLQPNTWDSTTVFGGLVAGDGIFAPSFSCFGPEISLSAPGVSIISTVPGGAFQAQSGTSMAAPHVTGLAALLLAHHPLFQTQYRERGLQRVQALVHLLGSVCSPYPFDRTRTGAGLPKLGPVMAALQARPGAPAPAVASAAMPPFAASPLLPYHTGAPYYTVRY